MDKTLFPPCGIVQWDIVALRTTMCIYRLKVEIQTIPLFPACLLHLQGRPQEHPRSHESNSNKVATPNNRLPLVVSTPKSLIDSMAYESGDPGSRRRFGSVCLFRLVALPDADRACPMTYISDAMLRSGPKSYCRFGVGFHRRREEHPTYPGCRSARYRHLGTQNSRPDLRTFA